MNEPNPYFDPDAEYPPDEPSINWTSATPGKEGWYWWRAGYQDDRPQCVEVLESQGGELFAALRARSASVRTWGGQWWPEPITCPSEGTTK